MFTFSQFIHRTSENQSVFFYEMNWLFIGNKHQRTSGILQSEHLRSTSDHCVTSSTEQSYWNIWGVFNKNTNGEQTALEAYVCGLSPVTGESPIGVSVKIKKRKEKAIKANFDKSSLLFNKFITTWPKASDITGLFCDPLLKGNRTESPIQNQVK